MTPLLQLTSDTKSFRTVPALTDVSSDLRRVAASQPGGLPDISRVLSVATPPVAVRNTSRTPEGCQNRLTVSPPSVVTDLWHPSGVRAIGLSTGRGHRRYAPQPPAGLWQPAGLRSA